MNVRISWIKVAALTGVVAIAFWGGRLAWSLVRAEKAAVVAKPELPRVTAADTMTLTKDAIQGLRVTTVPVIEAPPPPALVLSGTLVLDPNRMINIHTRFPGEVVEIGTLDHGVARMGRQPENPSTRPLQFGDHVVRGQLLGSIWCKEVGEKKSDLVDAITRLQASQVTLERLQTLPKGAVADQTVRDTKRAFDADLIAVERLERTLRSWRIGEEEMAEVYAEADRVSKGERHADPTVEKTWGEIALRAPFDGVILEKNVVVGDIVDVNQDLFKLADLDQLGVLANVFEEDLFSLHQLKPDQRKWSVQLKSNPELPPIYGEFDVIGKVIDPQQHSGRILGWVDNREQRLFVGQFINALVQLPSRPNEVAIPESAIIEGMPFSQILIADADVPSKVVERRVQLVRHANGMAIVRAQPSADDRQRGAGALHIGERVVSSSIVELLTALDEGAASEGLK